MFAFAAPRSFFRRRLTWRTRIVVVCHETPLEAWLRQRPESHNGVDMDTEQGLNIRMCRQGGRTLCGVTRAGKLAPSWRQVAGPLQRRRASPDNIAPPAAIMSAQELAERVRRLAEGLRAQPDLAAARALAAEGQALHESAQQLQQLEGGEQGRQQLRL